MEIAGPFIVAGIEVGGRRDARFDGGRAQLYGNFDESILEATLDALEKGLDIGGSDC